MKTFLRNAPLKKANRNWSAKQEKGLYITHFKVFKFLVDTCISQKLAVQHLLTTYKLCKEQTTRIASKPHSLVHSGTGYIFTYACEKENNSTRYTTLYSSNYNLQQVYKQREHEERMLPLTSTSCAILGW